MIRTIGEADRIGKKPEVLGEDYTNLLEEE